MVGYAARRLAQFALVFVGTTLLIYLAVFALPGDPIRGLSGGAQLPTSTVQTLREHYHLNDPVLLQYWHYISGLVRGDLGTDFYGHSVWDLMAERWPVTLKLAGTAWFFEVVIGVGLGILAALRKRKLSDHAVLVLTIGMIAIPGFVGAYIAQLVFGVRLRWFPIAGTADGWPMSYLLPALVLAMFGFASITRLMRSSLLENLRADYVRTAMAKGLTGQRIVTRHVLRNSLISVLTFIGLDLGYLLGGTVVIEGIFNLPGVGQLLFVSIQQHQGVVVVGVATALVLIFLLLNLVVDMLYGALDPRIRLG